MSESYTGIYPYMTVDDEFVGCLAGNLRAAARTVSRLYDDALRKSGLRITQLAVLAQVRRSEPVTASELASAMSAERSATARDLKLLEGEGLVRARPRTTDRRAREYSLTDRGRSRLHEAAPAWRLAQAQARDYIGAEAVDDLVALTAGVVQRLPTRPDAAS
jgi:DNA-binding MarR family transcriptional regulator